MAIDGDHRDDDRGGDHVAQAQRLGHEVTGCGAESEGHQDREPVERLAAGRDDRVDRQGALGAVPGYEHRCQGDPEDHRAEQQWHPEVVGQIVGDQRPEHADQRDRGPVQAGHVRGRAHLQGQDDRQQHPGHDRGPGEPKAEVGVEEVCGRLADRCAQDLDQPEVDRDFRDLVEQCLRPGRRMLGGHGREASESMMRRPCDYSSWTSGWSKSEACNH